MDCGIYCIENVENGKQYIGKSLNLEKRMWNDHKTCLAIGGAIKKHGDKIIRYIVEYCEPTQEKLNYWEKYYIREWNTQAPNGYNLSEGGDGPGMLSEEARIKLKNYIRTEEHKKKTSDTLKGRPKSEEWKQKMRKPRTEEAKRSLAGCQIGKYVSPETCELNSVLQIHRKKKEGNPASKFVGVSFSKGWWRADIRFNRKQKYVGTFKSEIDAANAFDIAYCEIYNKSFGINFPEIERKEK